MFAATPTLVEEDVPLILQEVTGQDSESPISPAQALFQLNQSLIDLTKVGQGWDRPELMNWINLTVSSDTADGGLISPVLPERMANIVAVVGRTGSIPNDDEYRAAYMYRRQGQFAEGFTFPRVEQRGNSLYLIGAGTLTLRLWYQANIAPLHYSVQPPGGGSPPNTNSDSSQLWINPDPDMGRFDPTKDIYLGQRVYIYAGTGKYQRGIITAQAARTSRGVLATVSWVDDGNAAVPLDDTTYYSLQPWISAQHYRYLTLSAAAAFKKRDGAQMIGEKYMTAQSQFDKWVVQIDASTPRRTNNDYGNDLGMDGMANGGSYGGWVGWL